jgi:hypothetical protein
MDAKKLTLVRFCYAPDGTFGYVDLGRERIWTVEREWNDNLPGKSCLPVGIYNLLPYSSEKYPNTYALENKGLQVWAYWSSEARRFACVFHSANLPQELEGCVSAGTRRGLVDDKWAVVSSKVATERLKEHIAKEGIRQFEIANQEPMGIWTPQRGGQK